MYYTTKISKFRHLAKRKAPWSDSRGPDRFRSQYRRLRLAATGRSSGPLDFCQHGAGLFAGAGVDVVVAEEDLRGRSAGSAVLGNVVCADVDGIGGGLFHELDAGCFGAGFGDYFDNQLLTDAKLPEDLAQYLIGGDLSSDGAECVEGGAEVFRNQVGR